MLSRAEKIGVRADGSQDAREHEISRTTLKHVKNLLSGIFRRAAQQGLRRSRSGEARRDSGFRTKRRRNEALLARRNWGKDRGHGWIGHIMRPEYALMLAENAKNMSGYLTIRQECCKIDLSAAAAPIGPDSMLSQSGKKSTKQKRRSVDYCIRQQF